MTGERYQKLSRVRVMTRPPKEEVCLMVTAGDCEVTGWEALWET